MTHAASERGVNLTFGLLLLIVGAPTGIAGLVMRYEVPGPNQQRWTECRAIQITIELPRRTNRMDITAARAGEFEAVSMLFYFRHNRLKTVL